MLHCHSELLVLKCVLLLIYNGSHFTCPQCIFPGTPRIDILCAAESGDIHLVKTLLKAGNIPITFPIFLDTPIHIASRKGHTGIVQELIDHGVKVNLLGRQGNTPLHEAVAAGHLEILQILLKSNADMRISNEHGNMPLHEAVLGGHLDLVKALVHSGGEDILWVKGGGGRIPVDIAEQCGHGAVLDYLKTAGEKAWATPRRCKLWG